MYLQKREATEWKNLDVLKKKKGYAPLVLHCAHVVCVLGVGGWQGTRKGEAAIS
jgi:hypothetical protein